VVKQGLFAVFLVLATQTLLVEGAGAENNPDLARVMWSAFSCATYAEMSGNMQEQERLFKLGYDAGRAFVDGVKNKTITEAETKGAPIGVLMLMGGPTTDFIIGRIFEGAAADAYDKVVKEDSAGLPIIDPSKWADEKLKVIRAKNRYQSSNCALIRPKP
jgi:hypothetical protein